MLVRSSHQTKISADHILRGNMAYDLVKITFRDNTILWGAYYTVTDCVCYPLMNSRSDAELAISSRTIPLYDYRHIRVNPPSDLEPVFMESTYASLVSEFREIQMGWASRNCMGLVYGHTKDESDYIQERAIQDNLDIENNPKLITDLLGFLL